MMKMSRQIYCLCSWMFFIVAGSANAQVSVKDSAISMVMIRPHYALQAPMGDMADRFGWNQSTGLSFSWKHKAGWIITADMAFIFGSKITEPGLFSGLTTPEGTIVGVDGLYGDIRLFERGYCTTLGLGRLFPVKKPNPNCGFVVEAGIGFMQHKIKIDDKKNAVPAVRDEYAKGYDRLCNGLALRQFVGYMHVGNRRLVNFYCGIEAMEAWTQSRRSFDFSTMQQDDTKRLDVLVGLRVGWIIALFKEAPDPFYLN